MSTTPTTGASDMRWPRRSIRLIIGTIPTVRNNYLQHFAEHGLDRLQYPVNPTDIRQIEEQLNMSINLISYYDDEGRARYPLYISRRNSPTEIDLLYFDGHYAWIKNFNRLFSDLTKHNGQKFFCKRCLGHFYDS